MVKDEVKDIFKEQFSKENNYRIIKQKVNKQHTYIRIIKYYLLPTFVVILCVVLIPTLTYLNNTNNIALANKKSKQEENIRTNIIKYEGNLTDNVTDRNVISIQNNKEDNDSTSNSKKEIYKTIEPAEACWAYDPTAPENLIKDHIETKYVIKVKVKSVGEAQILPKQENYYNPDSWLTPIKIEIEENLLGLNDISGDLTAYIDGGLIKISNLLKTISYSRAVSLGINNLTKEEKEQYIEYKSTGNTYYEPTIGKEYVIIVNKTNDNLYQIVCGAYGIFSVEKNVNGKEIYKNVKTEKTLDI